MTAPRPALPPSWVHLSNGDVVSLKGLHRWTVYGLKNIRIYYDPARPNMYDTVNMSEAEFISKLWILETGGALDE